MKVTREDLIAEYDRLSRQLVKVGGAPVVSDAALEIFSDGEIRALVKDVALQLIRIRRASYE